MKRLIVLVALLFAVPSSAEIGPLQATAELANPAISATALSASSTSFTLSRTPNSGAWGLLNLYVTVVDADNGVSAITMSCTTARTNINSGAAYTLQSCTVAAGVCTSDDASWVKNPGTGTSRFWWRVDIEGAEDVTCTFTDTGGDGSDSIRVDASLATKGS